MQTAVNSTSRVARNAGKCDSEALSDPDGLTFELAVDPADYDAIDKWQRSTAHETVKRWVGGDRTPNNDFRGDHTFQNLYT